MAARLSDDDGVIIATRVVRGRDPGRHRHDRLHRRALARRTEHESYMDAVLDGSVLRLRPKLMTVA